MVVRPRALSFATQVAMAASIAAIPVEPYFFRRRPWCVTLSLMLGIVPLFSKPTDETRSVRGGLLLLQRHSLLLQDLPHLFGGDRDVDVANAEVRQRVDDGVGDRRRRAHGCRLTDALGAERV